MVIFLRSPLTPPVLALTDYFKMMLTETNALRDTGKKEEPSGQYTPGKLLTGTHKQEHQCTQSRQKTVLNGGGEAGTMSSTQKEPNLLFITA